MKLREFPVAALFCTMFLVEFYWKKLRGQNPGFFARGVGR